MEEKVLRNPDMPGGRKDWQGRSPRWRLNLTRPEIEILREALELLMTHHNLFSDERYARLMAKITRTAEKIATPLVDATPTYPLFEEDFDFDSCD